LPHQAASIDFVLEGLCALKRISRAESGTFSAAEPRRTRGPQHARSAEGSMDIFDDEEVSPRGRKKYYN
jgi:hypothetical protein